MKIAINCLPFGIKTAGAGTFGYNILQRIFSYLPEEKIIVYSFEKEHIRFVTKNKKVKIYGSKIFSGLIGRIIYEQFVLPFSLYYRNIDVLFTPSVAIPLLFFKKKVTVIHDIAFIRCPQKYTFLRRLYIRIITYLSFTLSDVIVTVSEFSKSELLDYYKKRKMIFVAYNAIDHFKFQFDVAHLFETEKNETKYILYVGAIEPGKNVDVLIKAFENFCLQNNNDYSLFITGSFGWKNENIFKLISNSKVSNKIQVLDYQSIDQLRKLYKNAFCFVYLSSYEGFGIPVLEAMYSEIPIIASNIPALVEVTGGHAFHIDIGIENAVNALNEIHINKEKYLANIVKLAKKRTELFSWDISTQKIVSILKNEL